MEKYSSVKQTKPSESAAAVDENSAPWGTSSGTSLCGKIINPLRKVSLMDILESLMEFKKE